MSARQKLNSMYFGVAVVVAAFVGFLFQSVGIFIISFGALMAAFLHDGSLRAEASNKRRKTRKRR